MGGGGAGNECVRRLGKFRLRVQLAGFVGVALLNEHHRRFHERGLVAFSVWSPSRGVSLLRAYVPYETLDLCRDPGDIGMVLRRHRGR